MRYGLSDVGGSWIGILVFVIAVAAMVFAVIVGEGFGSFGAPAGSTRWWLGVGAAAVAVLVALGNRLR
jgi:hypothetical protein